MILRIRTKDKLEELLRHGTSPAWVVAQNRISKIDSVEIYQFDGKRVLKGKFDPIRSTRNQQGRLVVAFETGIIENSDFHWVGQNPIQYYNSKENDITASNWISDIYDITEINKLNNWPSLTNEELGELLNSLNQKCSIENYPGLIINTSYEDIFEDIKKASTQIISDIDNFSKELNEIEISNDGIELKFIKSIELVSKKLHEQGGQIYSAITPYGGSDTIFILMKDEFYHDAIILLTHFNETLNTASGWFSDFIADYPDKLEEFNASDNDQKYLINNNSNIEYNITEDEIFGNSVTSNYKVLGWDENYYAMANKGMKSTKNFC